MDSGSESISDPEELARVKRQAMRVHVQALSAAVLVTVALTLVPF